jgi:inorganic pyrophosphatase
MTLIATIEMPMGSTWKLEHDKNTNSLLLDRPLNQPVPFNYGYFSGTLCNDSDPIDVFLLTDSPIPPLVRVKVELVGVIKAIDNGDRDDKLIAVVAGDYQGLSTGGVSLIENYLLTYKNGFEILGFGDAVEAQAIYEASVELYKKDVARLEVKAFEKASENLLNTTA